MNEKVLIPISLFAAIFGILYVGITSRHRQRMAMIEKGLTPADLMNFRSGERNLSLKFGLLMVGVGLGVLIGYALSWVMPAHPDAYDPDPENPVPYIFSILLCGGIALVVEYVISRKQKA